MESIVETKAATIVQFFEGLRGELLAIARLDSPKQLQVAWPPGSRRLLPKAISIPGDKRAHRCRETPDGVVSASSSSAHH